VPDHTSDVTRVVDFGILIRHRSVALRAVLGGVSPRQLNRKGLVIRSLGPDSLSKLVGASFGRYRYPPRCKEW
jgi:hypothetical protein